MTDIDHFTQGDATKAPASFIIDSRTGTKVIAATEETKPHTQTVARVMGFLTDLGKNDFRFRENFSPKVKDTLCEEEILFPPYDANELQNILEQRADIALYDDVLETLVSRL